MPVSRFRTRDIKAAIFFLAPSVTGFLVFFLIPFIGGTYYSLVDSPIAGRFVGLANYINLLNNPVFLKAAGNTLVFSGIYVPLNIVISLVLAILLNKGVYGKSILRTAFIVPLVIPVASVVLVWQVIFDMTGSLNGLLHLMGSGGIDWMRTGWARIVVLIVYLWKNTGYNMVILLAGLQNIPVEYYEAADIDGAGPWRKFRSITLTYLTPTAFFVFIMSIINSFKVFRETYLIAGPYPQEGIYMLQHYMNNMFMSLDYQKLTAAAFLTAVLIFLLILVLFKVERRISSSLG
jgi:multiple sugar transport system permease protein